MSPSREYQETNILLIQKQAQAESLNTKAEEIKEDIMLRIASIVAEHGAEMAFPTRTVHVEPALEPSDGL